MVWVFGVAPACTARELEQAPLPAAAPASDAGAHAALSGDGPAAPPPPRAAPADAGRPAQPPAPRTMPPSAADEDAGPPSAPSQSMQPPAALPDRPVTVPQLSPPEVLGPLAGPGASTPQGLQLYGTDLGYTFVHQDRLYMLFGDSMPNARYYCDTHDPFEDDALATLPSALDPSQRVPQLAFLTQPGQPSEFATMRVTRDGAPIPMGLSRTAATAWSDGKRAIAMIGHVELTTCAPGSSGTAGCDAEAGFTCMRELGRCEPQVGDSAAPCGPGYPACALGQQCNVPKYGYCVDLSCSQYAGTEASAGYAITRNSEFAVQRPDEPNVFDTQLTFVSKKFHNSIARTVKRIAAHARDDDYAPGTGALLLFGRPGFLGERGGQAQLYLLKHALPLEVRDGKLVFEPEYFTDVDQDSGEPRWSHAQKDAVGLAMDGKRNGDPAEPLLIPNVSAISWLGAPIRKWIMLYGGDLPDVLLMDANAQPQTRGPIKVRFADYPWGPWTPMQDYFAPGKPDQVGAPYGPGGFLFHYACRDRDGAKCAVSDPVRPSDSFLPGCPSITPQLDIGKMYGLNIIDAYTQPSGAGLDMYWNVSTWNPYGVMLMRSHIEP